MRVRFDRRDTEILLSAEYEGPARGEQPSRRRLVHGTCERDAWAGSAREACAVRPVTGDDQGNAKKLDRIDREIDALVRNQSAEREQKVAACCLRTRHGLGFHGWRNDFGVAAVRA